jgi:uncharacterized protein (DUF1810 family)
MTNTLPSDPFGLQRFLEAQRDVYAQVTMELRAGRKQSHWMWYVFPQIKGLGQSPMAQKYSIASLEEAKAYLTHPALGDRLRECTRHVIAVSGTAIEDIFGYPDHLKFHSSMTLFAHATDDKSVFMAALMKYCHAEFDHQTIKRLKLQ